jgi:hypothetical protein
MKMHIYGACVHGTSQVVCVSAKHKSANGVEADRELLYVYARKCVGRQIVRTHIVHIAEILRG